MSAAVTLGVPVADAEDYPRPTPPSCRTPPSIPDLPIPEKARSIRLWWVAAGILTLAIGIALGRFLLPDSAAPNTSAGTPMPPAEVAATAELFVALHLSGTTPPADLAVFYSGDSPREGVTGYWANRTATISVEPIGEDVWLATVAADMLEPAGDAYESAGIHYYQLAVDSSGANPLTLSAPARIPRPDPASIPERGEGFEGAVPPDQQSAASAFLEAYLTGEGEAARFLSPATHLRLFETPPYTAASVVAIGSDPVGRLRAGLDVTSASGATARLDYMLTMTFERGIWEVVAAQPVGPGR